MSTRPLVVAGTLAVAVAGAVACGTADSGGDDARLRALRADPLGRYVPTGARPLSSDGRGAGGSGLLGKPTAASWRRTFAAPTNADAAIEATLEAARAAGWAVGRPVPGLGSSATKRLATGSAAASITLVRDPALLPPGAQGPVLGIALEHARE